MIVAVALGSSSASPRRHRCCRGCVVLLGSAVLLVAGLVAVQTVVA